MQVDPSRVYQLNENLRRVGAMQRQLSDMDTRLAAREKTPTRKWKPSKELLAEMDAKRVAWWNSPEGQKYRDREARRGG